MPVSGWAQNADARVRYHAQCFLLFASLAENEDAGVKASGLMGSLFFAGQIFGADPSVDLERLLKVEALAMNDVRSQQILPQCGQEMQGRGAQITAAGKALEQLDMSAPKRR